MLNRVQYSQVVCLLAAAVIAACDRQAETVKVEPQQTAIPTPRHRPTLPPATVYIPPQATPTPEVSPTPAIKGVAPAPDKPEVKPVAKQAEVARKLTTYQRGWQEAKMRPVWEISINKAVMLYERTKERYEAIQNARPDGVPAPVLFGLHMRESSNSFNSHLHEGSSLLARTKYIPKGRPLPPAKPPFTWEESALDAVYNADKLQGPWTDLDWSLNRIEGYNGMGYRKKGMPSPYLWSGTTVYVSGKYVADGKFSPTAVDQQLGVVTVLKKLKERGHQIHFAP